MKKLFLSVALLLTAFTLKATPTPPDEGMWLPMFVQRLNHADMQKMGLRLSAEELYSINHSSLKDAIVQFDNGCTGEMVSPKGLLFTNHHCGYEAIQSQSTVEHDYLANGFWAYDMSQELPIPGLTVSFLIRMDDVTASILSGFNEKTNEAERQATIEERIGKMVIQHSEDGRYRVEIKPFFEGLEYYMFIYETFTDVRLVGAPPSSIGKFGGDTDNWMWPRHTGDFSVFRVYGSTDGSPADYNDKNIPITPKHYLPISLKGVENNDFTMIWGYPGSTSRYMTSYEVANTLEHENPALIEAGGKIFPAMKKAMDRNTAIRITYASDYAQLMNMWKNKIGETRGLKNLNVYKKKKDIEDRLADWINADSKRKEKYAHIIPNLETSCTALAKSGGLEANMYANMALMANKRLLTAFQIGNTIKMQMQDGKLPQQLTDALLAYGMQHYETYPTQVEKEIFTAVVEFMASLPETQQPAFVSKMLNKKYKKNAEKLTEDVFKKSIFGTKEAFQSFMNKPKEKQLKNDPMFEIATDIIALIFNKGAEIEKAEDLLAVTRRDFMGALREMDSKTVSYPDANFTLRMTYGTVKDYYPADAIHYDFITTLEGVMEKEDPANDEFIVPEKLKQLYEKKDYGRYADKNGKLVTCFLSTNDITGGNSGSPIMNANGELIGLAFDGNWEAMSGDIAFEPELQRTINVDIRYVLFIIDKFAGAKNLIDELTIVQ